MNRLESIKMHSSKLGFIQTAIYLLQRAFTGRGKYIKVKIRGVRKPVKLRSRFYDTHIFTQIFVREEVNFNLTAAPEVIIDCGANIGLSTLYFKSIYPKASIFSYEPEKSNYALLELNTMYEDNIRVNHAAIWSNATTLNVVDTGEGNASFVTRTEAGDNVIERIPAFSLNDIVAEEKLEVIDLVKIDVEGSEYEIFSAHSIEWIKRAKVIAIEIHEHIKPGVTKLINDLLEPGFDRRKVGEYTVYENRQLSKP